MAENGNNWIKLNRSITDHWLWSSGECFSRGQAFIDLLLMAAYADHKVMSQGRMIELKRGSMITSVRYLADRWRWSKDKTLRFLNDLEADGTIKKASDTKRTQTGRKTDRQKKGKKGKEIYIIYSAHRRLKKSEHTAMRRAIPSILPDLSIFMNQKDGWSVNPR